MADKPCKFCGAPVKAKDNPFEGYIQWECLTANIEGHFWGQFDRYLTRSLQCFVNENCQLKAQIERVAAAVKKIDPMVTAILHSWAYDALAPVKEPILDSWMKELTVISLMLGAALKDLEAPDGA